MRQKMLLLAVMGASLLLYAGGVLAQEAPSDRGAHPYIVVLEDDISNPGEVAREHARRHGAEVSHVYRYAIEGYAARISEARLDDVRGDSRVRFISEDRKVQAVAQTLPTGLNRIEGDASSTLAGNGNGNVNVPVAIIDTGIDVDHPDLNVVGGKNCSTGNSYDDGNGHGTHVAGTVAARDNTVGVVGVAPGTPLYAVRVLDNSGYGSWSSVVCGIDWVSANAASKGIKVANMSLGGSGSDDANCGITNRDALHRAICNSVASGVTYVVAAGNSGGNLRNFVPAAYNEVLTVSAVADFNGRPGGGAAPTCRSDVDDTAANFSNFTTKGHADESHTIAAPGVCIRSTWKGGRYKTISGTSMASPHAAGTAALCIASGQCTGGPRDIMSKLRSDAAAQPASYGFAEDPHQVTATGSRHYGFLEYAGGY
jgi:subtilisin